jgi:signal transduction histidine kinase
MTWELAVALGSAMVVGACYGGALTADPGQPTASLVRLIGVTIGVSVALGLLLVPIFASMLLQPISDLTDATRGVARGDRHGKVAVINNDEVGELEQSFNAMLDVLRERGELRAHNELLVAELQASLARLVRAGDTARRRVERDLHDGAQQQITLIGLKLRMLQEQHDSVTDDGALLVELQDDVRTALRELRDLAHGVFPAELDEGGLAPALRFALARSGLPYELDCQLERRHRPELETALYFTCLEAVQNIAKHAGPGATARVVVRERDDAVELEGADVGRGFDDARGSTAASGSGLQGIADRVGALGGDLRVTSAIDEGTVLRARVPT